MTIQISLRAARVNAGKTIVQAARELGIGKDTLLKWEHNPGLVNPIYQQRISEVYKFPTDCINFSPLN